MDRRGFIWSLSGAHCLDDVSFNESCCVNSSFPCAFLKGWWTGSRHWESQTRETWTRTLPPPMAWHTCSRSAENSSGSVFNRIGPECVLHVAVWLNKCNLKFTASCQISSLLCLCFLNKQGPDSVFIEPVHAVICVSTVMSVQINLPAALPVSKCPCCVFLAKLEHLWIKM